MPAWKNGSLLPRSEDRAIIRGEKAELRVPATGVGHVLVSLPDDRFELGMGLWGSFFKFDLSEQEWRQRPDADLDAYLQSASAR